MINETVMSLMCTALVAYSVHVVLLKSSGAHRCWLVENGLKLMDVLTKLWTRVKRMRLVVKIGSTWPTIGLLRRPKRHR